jgi:hypothetical protein
MRITKAEQVQLGKIYMYNKWSHLGTLEIGECVRISKDSIELKQIGKNTTYTSTDEIKFIKETFPTLKYNTILDYDKQIFNAYNSEIEKHKERLEKILDGNIKPKRKSKKKSWFHKLLKKLKLKK